MDAALNGFEAVVAEGAIIIEVIARLGGAVCGSAMALVYGPPASLQGFIRRGMAGLIGGSVFAPYIRERLGFTADWEGMLMAATLGAFASWHVMGAIIAAVKRR